MDFNQTTTPVGTLTGKSFSAYNFAWPDTAPASRRPQWWLAVNPGTYTHMGGITTVKPFTILAFDGINWIAVTDHLYQVRNFGDAAIFAGTTAITIAHTLGYAPHPAFIHIIAENDLGNATKFFIDNITANDFQLNVNVDPTTKDALFNWKITY